ncbi:MAG TPA: cytochrome b5 domain-containing protein, partial [Candidatus Acidoferrum sp.]|nr:cytochrome b5 domain-containing protein [Candidatus Acidoferrum sp.]
AGSTSQQVSITVTQPVVYCGGKSPCYGPSDMAAHKVSSNCWGYNINIVYNLTAFAPVHPGGSSRIGGPECGNNIAGYLNGSLSNNGSHDHSSSTKNNTSSLLLQYKVGYYDANKP